MYLIRDEDYIIDENEFFFPSSPIKKDIQQQRKKIFGFTNPLSISWFFSIIGSEYCHTYFWILKDLSWMQNWKYMSILFGFTALIWSLLLFYHSLRTMNWHETWNFFAIFLWLFANFMWMVEEVFHDVNSPENLDAQYSNLTSLVLAVALAVELIYFLFLVPFKIIKVSSSALFEYDDGRLKSRFSCFQNFRQYENLHMLFWISKDLAWNILNAPLWIISFIPTFFLSLDFLMIAWKSNSEDSIVDIINYLSLFFWVVGNSMWAFGNFFIDEFDAPLSPIPRSNKFVYNLRWYGSWVLILSLIPIVSMYIMWTWLTLTHQLKPLKRTESNLYIDSSHLQTRQISPTLELRDFHFFNNGTQNALKLRSYSHEIDS